MWDDGVTGTGWTVVSRERCCLESHRRATADHDFVTHGTVRRGGRAPSPPGCGAAYCIEFRPNSLPSVSVQSVTHPNDPIENFGRSTFPPAGSTRASATAQSGTLK